MIPVLPERHPLGPGSTPGSLRGSLESLLSRKQFDDYRKWEMDNFVLTFEFADIGTLAHSASKPPASMATSDVNSRVSLLVSEVKVGGEVVPQ